jgi:hypothetical protein
MSKKLTGYDVGILNEYITSPDKKLSQLGRDQLAEYIKQPECFADSIAADWARRIYRRITRLNALPEHP